MTGLQSRLGAFVAERFPLALTAALESLQEVGGDDLKPRDADKLEAMRLPYRKALARRLYQTVVAPDGVDETTPGTSAIERLEQARAEIVEGCDGFLRREAIARRSPPTNAARSCAAWCSRAPSTIA